MRPWGDIKLSAQRARLLSVLTFRRWVLEDLAFNDWLDADYEQYLIEQLPVERARLLRVLDARFVRLYSEGLENEAMHWFRTDFVRVLRARIRDLFPKTIACPECGAQGLNAETADPRCELCRGGWFVWEYRIRMANGCELRAWSNVDHASEARARALKG